MRIPGYGADGEDDYRRAEGPYQGYELKGKCNGRQQNRIRHAQDAEHDAEGDEGGAAQEQERAHVLQEQSVNVGECLSGSLLPALKHLEKAIADLTPIAQDEETENGDDNDIDQIRRGRKGAKSQLRHGRDDVVVVLANLGFD